LGTTYEKLLQIFNRKGAGYFILLDPDKKEVSEALELAFRAQEGGADAILVGGSLLFADTFEALLREMWGKLRIPVIIFPGNSRQISRYADAILFLSLISGRNPNYLIGEQVLAAPIIRSLGLEAIPTGYILVESGRPTTVEFLSNTRPIPRNKVELAVAHALAAEYLGMKFIYLEAGSGAEHSIPTGMITAVREAVSMPIVVGGGIRTPEEAEQKVHAGASFVVTGNVLEGSDDLQLIREFAEAIHVRKEQSGSPS